MSEFKDILKNLRKQMNLSQNELAKILKVSTSTIGMYESGKRYPSRDVEEHIADLFNINIDELRGKAHKVEAEPTEENAGILATLMKDKNLFDYVAKITELDAVKREQLFNFIDFLLNQ